MLDEICCSCSSESPGDGISCSRACTRTVHRMRSASGMTSLLQNVIVSKQQRKDEVKLKASHGAASSAISQKNISEYWLQGRAARHQRTLQKYHGRRTAETAPQRGLHSNWKKLQTKPSLHKIDKLDLDTYGTLHPLIWENKRNSSFTLKIQTTMPK